MTTFAMAASTMAAARAYAPVFQEPIVVPTAVYVLWIIALVLAVLVVLPLMVYLLQRTLSATRNIARYMTEMRDAGTGIASHTHDIKALDDTIVTAGIILEAAGSVKEHAAALESTLATRASADGRR